MNKWLEKINIKKYGWSLALSIVIYFTLTRIWQDWFYHLKGLDIRPEGLFESLGSQFLIAEPYEIFIYMASYLLIPLLALLIYPVVSKIKLPKTKINKRYLIFTGIVLVILGIVAIILKAPWDTLFNYLQTRGLGHALWLVTTKRLFVSYLILGLTTIFLIGYYFFLSAQAGEKKKWLDKLLKPKYEKTIKKLQPLWFVLLAILIFHPNFPVDAHHYNYFIGAVNDVFQGKALLYETSHLYGLFDIYFLLPIFSFIPLGFATFSLVVTVFFFLFFIGIYWFISKWLKSSVLALLGTGMVLSLIYFFQVSPTRSALFFPNMSPFRLGLYVIVLFFMLGFYRTYARKYIHLALGTSAVAFFWNYDSGIFLSLAVLGTFTYHFLVTKQYKEILKTITYYLIYLGSIFGLVNLINFWIYGSLPNWTLFFRETDEFVYGAGMYPLPAIGLYQILLFTYLGVLLSAGYAIAKRKAKFNLPVLFLALLGSFSAIYYIGESTWQLLYAVTVPFVLILLFLFKNYRDWKIVRLGFVGLLVFSSLLLIFKIPVELSSRNYLTTQSSLLGILPEDQALYEDAIYIKNNFPDKRIPLAYLKDTKFLIYAEKANYFDFYYMFTIYFEDDLQKYIKQVLEEQPSTVFIGKEKDDRIEQFLSGIESSYIHIKSLQTLDIYSLKK